MDFSPIARAPTAEEKSGENLFAGVVGEGSTGFDTTLAEKIQSILEGPSVGKYLSMIGITLIGSGLLYGTLVWHKSYPLSQLYERLIEDVTEFADKYQDLIKKHAFLWQKIQELLNNNQTYYKRLRLFRLNGKYRSLQYYFQSIGPYLLIPIANELVKLQKAGDLKKDLESKLDKIGNLDFSNETDIREIIILLEALMMNIDVDHRIPHRILKALLTVGLSAATFYTFYRLAKGLKRKTRPKPKRKTKTQTKRKTKRKTKRRTKR